VKLWWSYEYSVVFETMRQEQVIIAESDLSTVSYCMYCQKEYYSSSTLVILKAYSRSTTVLHS